MTIVSNDYTLLTLCQALLLSVLTHFPSIQQHDGINTFANPILQMRKLKHRVLFGQSNLPKVVQ